MGTEELPERAKRNALFGPPSFSQRERIRAVTCHDGKTCENAVREPLGAAR